MRSWWAKAEVESFLNVFVVGVIWLQTSLVCLISYRHLIPLHKFLLLFHNYLRHSILSILPFLLSGSLVISWDLSSAIFSFPFRKRFLCLIFLLFSSSPPYFPWLLLSLHLRDSSQNLTPSLRLAGCCTSANLYCFLWSGIVFGLLTACPLLSFPLLFGYVLSSINRTGLCPLFLDEWMAAVIFLSLVFVTEGFLCVLGLKIAWS